MANYDGKESTLSRVKTYSSKQKHLNEQMKRTDVQRSQKDGVPNQPSDKVSPLTMLTIILAVFMAILDTSIVNVALPKMMAVFGVTPTQIQWVLTAYTLVVGALVPVTAYLSDRFGSKKLFLYALVIFTIGSGLCGMAWSNSSMVFFRIIQALGGGALMPVSMTMILRMFPPDRRGLGMGILGIAVMFAPAIGPTLSGYITEYLDWRLIFYINVPIGIVNFFLAMATLSETDTVLGRKKFDLIGFLASTIGFSTLLYGLGKVSELGWSNSQVVILLVIASISLAIFVITEVTVEEPMLDLTLFKNFTFTISQMISAISSIILMGSLFLLPIFLQNVSGLSAIQTGLLLLPQALMLGVMMPISGVLFDRIGARLLAVVGLLITSYSLYLTHNIDINTPTSILNFWLVLRAIGVGLVMMPVQTASVNTVPMNKVGQNTAITNTIRQVSASFGIAWFALLLSQRQIFHSAILSDEMNQFSPSVTTFVNQIQHGFSASGLTETQAHISTLKYIYGQIQIHSMVQAIDDIFFVVSILALAAAVLSLFLRNTKAKKGEAKREAAIAE